MNVSTTRAMDNNFFIDITDLALLIFCNFCILLKINNLIFYIRTILAAFCAAKVRRILEIRECTFVIILASVFSMVSVCTALLVVSKVNPSFGKYSFCLMALGMSQSHLTQGSIGPPIGLRRSPSTTWIQWKSFILPKMSGIQ